jgi:2-dehydropantoate 2-reductase
VKIVILGAGALGSLVGALLARAGHDVTLIARHAHVEAVNRDGLRVSGLTEAVTHPRAVTDASSAPVPDVLVVTVKAYETLPALKGARNLLGPATRVVTLQNGLGNLEIVESVAAEGQAVGGATTIGATFMEAGHVRHAGHGYLKLGSPTGNAEAVDAVAAPFRDAGLDPEVTDNIHGEVWAKVVVNAGINPLTAITGLPNGALLETPALFEVLVRACEEAVDVAKAVGVQLPDEDLVLRARRVAELTAENKSSMLQDVERGRRTEIDAISGAIWQRGLSRAVDTPVNMTLTALVKGIERTITR